MPSSPPPESGSSVPPPGCPVHLSAAVDGPAALEAGGCPLYTPEFTADPWPIYQKLREHGPIAPVELAPGVRAWLVLDYATALKVLRSPETYSKDSRCWRALNAGEIPPDSPVLPVMTWQPNALFADGEEHHRLRQVVVDSLAKVDPYLLRGHVERHADRLVDQFAASGRAELVGQYAQALPVLVLSELYGAPGALGRRMLDAVLRLASGRETRAALAEMRTCTAELVALRRESPGEDVTSWTLAHPAALDDQEAVSTLQLSMGYGGTALRLLMATALRMLLCGDRFDGDLAGGSASVDDILNEVLWHDPPVANYAPHFPVRDVDLSGVRLREGDPVFVSLAAVSADPSVVVDSRSGNRAHLAWGAGPHACPAQSQARVIATVAMEKLLDRLPDVELAVPISRLEWNPGPFFRSSTALPVRFSPVPLSGLAAGSPPAAGPEPGPVPAPGTAAAGADPDAGTKTDAGTGAGAAGRRAPARASGAPRRLGGLLAAWWRGQRR